MAHYAATISSRRPAPETFGYLATFSNAAHWDPGVLAGEQLDPGPVGVGTRFRLVVPFLGRRMTLVYKVTTHVPGREVVPGRGQPPAAGHRPHRGRARWRRRHGQLRGRCPAARTAADP